MVNVESRNRGATGTGWVYSARDGFIVTAFHVTNGASVVGVKAGRRPWQPATVVAAAPCEDIALLAVGDKRGLQTMPLAGENAVLPGEHVTGLGFSGDSVQRPWRSTRGVITNVRIALGPVLQGKDTPALDDLLETTSIATPGLSGGPVVDDGGRLLAMMFSTYTAAPGASPRTFSVRVDRLRETITAFHQGRAPGWVGSGLYFRHRAPQRAPQLPRGVIVTGLPAGLDGGYAHAGVLVTAANGIPVGDSFASWCRTVGSLPAGQATLTIIRQPGGPATTATVSANSPWRRPLVPSG